MKLFIKSTGEESFTMKANIMVHLKVQKIKWVIFLLVLVCISDPPK